MHQYLKAIGFGPIKKKAELKEILEQTRETFTHQMTVSYNEEADYCEFQKEYGQDVGITLCGELDDHDQFDMEYYFPYFQEVVLQHMQMFPLKNESSANST